jgi:hypothetical protein
MIRKRWWMLGATAAALAVAAAARPEQTISTPTPAPASIRVETRSPSSAQTKTYQVADLIVPLPMEGDPPQGKVDATTEDLLIKMIPHLIAPGTWSEQGGSGTIDYFPLTMSFVVNQTPAVQEQVARFLDMLRTFQPMEFAIEMRLGKGCARADETEMMPKVAVFDGQRMCLNVGSEKDGLKVEMQAMRVEGDRVGVSLHIRKSDNGRNVEVRTVREATFDEPFKIKLGEPAKGEPFRWMEFVVRRIEEPKEASAAVLPNPVAVADDERLVPVPAATGLQAAEGTGVIQAAYNTRPKKETKESAKMTLQLSRGDELTIKTAGARVIVESKTMTAHADHATVERGGDGLLLDGNVHLKYHKTDREGSVSANKLRIDLRDGSVDLEPGMSDVTNSMPVSSLGSAPYPSTSPDNGSAPTTNSIPGKPTPPCAR